MFDTVATPFTFTVALGSGLIAGTFFAFSTFVMGALARLPVPQGIAAMQSINVVVINPLFLGVFIGTAILVALLAVMACLNWSAPGTLYLLAGAALYLAGCFLVTMVGNVPLNNALDAVAPDSAEGAALWMRYLQSWNFWNHVRGGASLLASAVFILALR